MGDKKELDRFTELNVYEPVLKEVADGDQDGTFVKTKWVRVNKGTRDEPEIKCRLVAQELGYGERLDELYAGTPSMDAVKLAMLHSRVIGSNREIMIIDVKILCISNCPVPIL